MLSKAWITRVSKEIMDKRRQQKGVAMAAMVLSGLNQEARDRLRKRIGAYLVEFPTDVQAQRMVAALDEVDAAERAHELVK